jgi:hypothetical protein
MRLHTSNSLLLRSMNVHNRFNKSLPLDFVLRQYNWVYLAPKTGYLNADFTTIQTVSSTRRPFTPRTSNLSPYSVKIYEKIFYV